MSTAPGIYVGINGAWVSLNGPVPVDTSPELYRPVAISDPSELPHAPADANYVTWSWARSSGMTLHEAFQTLNPNDILVLPEDELPYEVDSSSGFVADSQRDVAMARAKRGLVGLGPGTIVQTSESAYSEPPQDGSTGNRNKVLECWATGGYFGNFEMRGRDFGGVAYDALKHEGANSVFERIFCNAAHRGFLAYPPGEAGGLVSHGGNGVSVYNCEVECRDSEGERVGTSPVMFNSQNNVLIQDCYFHHAREGFPTFWNVTNVTTRRVRSEYNEAGFNHELVGGTVRHEDPMIIIDRANNPNSLHLQIGTNTTDAIYDIVRPRFDAGVNGPGEISIQYMTVAYPGHSQSDENIHIVDAVGNPIPFTTYD